ncbi:MAG: hypothetical protein SVW57_05865 [Thermodesulfobacteriota bacterium]|nr:hypothetical protein [Thermodesulfobacteriota bacterium]
MDQSKGVRDRITQEAMVQEKTDQEGNRWRKVYCGGGSHYKNWLEQFKELGEVEVEEIDSTGFQCFEEGDEKMYRVWLKEVL